MSEDMTPSHVKSLFEYNETGLWGSTTKFERRQIRWWIIYFLNTIIFRIKHNTLNYDVHLNNNYAVVTIEFNK